MKQVVEGKIEEGYKRQEDAEEISTTGWP